MTFTYIGARVPTPTDSNVTGGGKQESPANICTVDSQGLQMAFPEQTALFPDPIVQEGLFKLPRKSVDPWVTD